jgi:hypothetical protein
MFVQNKGTALDSPVSSTVSEIFLQKSNILVMSGDQKQAL